MRRSAWRTISTICAAILLTACSAGPRTETPADLAHGVPGAGPLVTAHPADSHHATSDLVRKPDQRTGAILLVAAPVAAQDASTVTSGAQVTLVPSVSESSFGNALNQIRAQNGLGALREDGHLARAAQAHAQDLASHGYFSHQGRDGSTVVDRARAAGCRGRGYFAENIAWGNDSANDAFQGWARSSGHLRNMLGRKYGAYGLGQASGYWVLVFADGC